MVKFLLAILVAALNSNKTHHSGTIIAIFLFTLSAYGAEFSATVDKTEMNVDDELILTFTLSGDSSEHPIDLSKISENFDVVGSRQSSSIKIINTTSTSSHVWSYTLDPKSSGDFEIPEITINTTQSGKISSKPIKIKVKKTTDAPAATKNDKLFVITKTSKTDPFINEPLIYQVKLYTQYDLADTKFDDLTLDDAVIRQIGGYKVSDAKHNGQNYKVLELNYVITPAKSGKIIIPSQKIKGVLFTNEVQKKHPTATGIDALFDSFMDEQSLVRSSKKFTSSSPETVLDVSPNAGQVNPWIPAESIGMEASLANDSLQIGKAIQYKIKINAKGLLANQLPKFTIEDLKGDHYKVYADNSDTSENIEDLSISSSRTQVFTIVPIQAGKITLPQLKIDWWDVKNNKASSAIIPSRTLDVEGDTQSLTVINGDNNNSIFNQDATPTSNISDSNSKYIIIILSVLVILLATLLIIIIYKFKTAFSKKEGQPQKKELPKLSSSNINTPKELYSFLQEYAHRNWKSPSNASLATIFSFAQLKDSAIKKEDYISIMKELEDALYAGREVDIKLLTQKYLAFLRKVKSGKINIKNKKDSNLPDLNPG